MMWKEFEKLAGYEVSYEDYHKIIEPMYMATELSKAEFIKCIDRKRFALRTKNQLINKAKKIAKHLMETCEHYTDFDAQHELDGILQQLAERFDGHWRIHMEYTYPDIQRGCTYPKTLIRSTNDWRYITEEYTLT